MLRSHAFSKYLGSRLMPRKPRFLSQHFSLPPLFWQRSQPHTGSRGSCGPCLGGHGGGFGLSSQQHGAQGSCILITQQGLTVGQIWLGVKYGDFFELNTSGSTLSFLLSACSSTGFFFFGGQADLVWIILQLTPEFTLLTLKLNLKGFIVPLGLKLNSFDLIVNELGNM